MGSCASTSRVNNNLFLAELPVRVLEHSNFEDINNEFLITALYER